MKKRMNEAQYKEFKATFVTLKKAGKNVSQIRDLLGIGNGTSQYIDQTETFAEYCKLRDEVLNNSASARKREEERKLRLDGIKAAKAVMPQKAEKKVIVESPANIEKLIRSNMREFREFLENDYADAIVARVVTALSVPGEDAKENKKAPWWKNQK